MQNEWYMVHVYILKYTDLLLKLESRGDSETKRMQKMQNHYML